MALKIVARPEFETTVKVNLAWLQGEFSARFVAMPIDALEALQAEAPVPARAEDHVLQQVCLHFDDVELPDGKLAYTGPESVAKLLAWPGIGPAMSAAYFKALWGAASGN